MYGHKSLLCKADVPADKFQIHNSNSVLGTDCKNCKTFKSSNAEALPVNSASSTFSCCEVVHGSD